MANLWDDIQAWKESKSLNTFAAIKELGLSKPKYYRIKSGDFDEYDEMRIRDAMAGRIEKRKDDRIKIKLSPNVLAGLKALAVKHHVQPRVLAEEIVEAYVMKQIGNVA